MRGEFFPIWGTMWETFWKPLQKKSSHLDLFCELSRAAVLFKEPRADLAAYAIELSDVRRGRDFFRVKHRTVVTSEHDACQFLNYVYAALNEFETDCAELYRKLLAAFIDTYSLRYEIRDDCRLVQTLPGVYAHMIRNLKVTLKDEPNLAPFLDDFMEAVGDYVERPTEGRLKTTLVKVYNMLEALAQHRKETKSNTLGACAREIDSFPHPSIASALSSMYGFRCDKAGVNHGKLAKLGRRLHSRDFIALNTILLGFVPYLIDELNCELG